jgi:hypothetical protein
LSGTALKKFYGIHVAVVSWDDEALLYCKRGGAFVLTDGLRLGDREISFRGDRRR